MIVLKKDILDFLWKVLDKFGYPVLVAFFLSVVTLIILPNTYVEKVPFPDNQIYWACAILMVFFTLLIALVRQVWKGYAEKKYWSSYKAEMEKREENKIMQSLWNDVDSFSESDRMDIMEFLKTENKPIAKNEHCFDSNSLYKSNWIISIEKRITEDYIDTDIETGKKEVFTRITTHIYKLKPVIYETLKRSMEIYGKISNFDI